MQRSRARRAGATALVWLTAALLILATLTGYARWALFDSDQFANRASATLRNDSVRSLISTRVTDEVILKQQADLISARPIIQSVVSSIVGGAAFRTLFLRAVRDVHRAVFKRDQNTVTLTLGDVGTVAGAALEKLRPSLAAQLEQSGKVTLVNQRFSSATGTAARWARNVSVLAFVLAGLTLVSAVGALVLSTDRRRTVTQLGVGIAVAGVLLVIAYTVARTIVLSQLSDPDDRAAGGGVWNTFLGDLRTWGWVLAGAGAVIAAAASSLLQPVEIEGVLRRGWRIATTEPRAKWLHVLRALALIALGIGVIASPATALQVVATLVGVYIVYLGVEAILRMTYRPQHPDAEEEIAALGHRLRQFAVPAFAVVLIAGGVAIFLASGGTSETASASVKTCNGYAALCDKTLPEVVLPATHNSMSAPLPGWFSSEQDRGIGGQLDDGIRGFLIDTHYGDKLSNGKVRTDIQGEAALKKLISEDAVSQDQVDAALRLRERVGFKGEGTRGMYLCHTLCELGATPLSTALGEIHDFIVTNPDNVLVIVNQDYVTPADYVKAIEDAGLGSYVYKGLGSSKWPTLREMIENGQQIVFLAENQAGGASWYQLAYKSLLEETPYQFPKASLLTSSANLDASCEPNRGPSSAPLFLENHWVTTDPLPLPSNAAKVNAYEPLLRRTERCEQIRHHVVNLLAVNFYKRGDLFKVVNKLNGVS